MRGAPAPAGIKAVRHQQTDIFSRTYEQTADIANRFLDTYSHVLPGMQEDAAMQADAALRPALHA